MRFMMMHKTDAATEAGALPTPEFIGKMGALMGELAKSGELLDGGGLRPTSTGVRLNFKNGQRTVTKGPFKGNNELISGFVILRLKSLDEAIERATKFADVVGDIEIDIRPIVEAWDLGVMPKPPDVTTTRYMLAHKADKASEAGTPPTPEVMAKIGKLMEDLHKDGVFLGGEGLKPSSKSRRLTAKGGKISYVDGPFTESKELIAGYVMVNVPSLDAAMKWATPFAELCGDVEMDIRPIYEEEDFAQA